MKIIDINKEKFFNMLTNPKPYFLGKDSLLIQENGKMYKIFYRDFINAYNSKRIDRIDYDVDMWFSVENRFDTGKHNPQIKLKEFERLLDTKSKDLVTGVLSYRNLYIGLEMTYYSDYITLAKASTLVSKEVLDSYLEKCLILVNDLLDHNIFPCDLKANNVVVNIQTGDVVLIDLDGKQTIYGNQERINDFTYNRKVVVESFNAMRNRLYEKYSLSNNKIKTR